MSERNTFYDCIIIGKGPAGISAGIYIKRSNLSVLVIGKDAGSLGQASKIENFYGTGEALPGIALFNKGISQAQKLDIPIITDEVTHLEVEYSEQNSFKVFTASGKTYNSKTVLIATGKKSTNLKIAGFEEYKGKGISFCAVCDGFFYKQKRLAVVGSGEYALSELLTLSQFTNNITLLTNGEAIKFDKTKLPNYVKIIPNKISQIKGNGTNVSEIVFDCATDSSPEGIGIEDSISKTSLEIDGIFIALGSAGATDFAATIGLQTGTNDNGSSNGTLLVSKDYETTVKGLFAAGDAIGGFLQISKAVADGAIASKSIIKRIFTEREKTSIK